ncbi:MAG: hypothetical protein ACFB5Z_10435 [Elainellaceae cyanobacterium]
MPLPTKEDGLEPFVGAGVAEGVQAIAAVVDVSTAEDIPEQG